MLRRLMVNANKAVDATLKAGAAMKRGLLVQKDFSAGTVVLPTSDEGLYFVTKDNYPTGLLSLQGELSDYDTNFETIASGEAVLAEKPVTGEKYATDQFVATSLVADCYATVSTTVDANQGKIIYSATAAKFKYVGTITDNGKTLAVVEIL